MKGGYAGKMSVETLEDLFQETGEKNLRASVIGPAEEKQSLMACIINDRHRAAGCKVDHKSLMRNFFAAMGWDEETGKPSRESLEALGGMDDVVQDLYG